VILVRHAMPEVVPGVPPHEWELGDEGRAAARDLAARLEPGRIVTSDEPKAVQTAEEIARGAQIVLDARLREVARPTAWRPDYRDRARRYVGGEALEGWERHADVIARVTAAARGDIVVTHGLAMTLYLGESVEFWAELRFPDAWSALAGHLRRVD
jgi:2,3-bisphosphoglycerate-dependent phosphoglycerate mutase